MNIQKSTINAALLVACVGLASSGLHAAELVQFSNGTVADADDVNANFTELSNRISELSSSAGDGGIVGPQGPKGDTGATGATGPQGPAGSSSGDSTVTKSPLSIFIPTLWTEKYFVITASGTPQTVANSEEEAAQGKEYELRSYSLPLASRKFTSADVNFEYTFIETRKRFIAVPDGYASWETQREYFNYSYSTSQEYGNYSFGSEEILINTGSLQLNKMERYNSERNVTDRILTLTPGFQLIATGVNVSSIVHQETVNDDFNVAPINAINAIKMQRFAIQSVRRLSNNETISVRGKTYSGCVRIESRRESDSFNGTRHKIKWFCPGDGLVKSVIIKIDNNGVMTSESKELEPSLSTSSGSRTGTDGPA